MIVSLICCGHWGKNLFRNFYDLGELDFFQMKMRPLRHFLRNLALSA